MPYKLQKVKGGYYVETEDSGKKHSDKPMTHMMAVKQMKVMYANMPASEKKKKGK